METLLQFTVGNYRSFHQARTFSMVPSSIQDNPKECVVAEGHYRYLTAAAVYGANSSGKSNLVMALATMKRMVLNSVKLNDHDFLFYDPFLLAEDSGNQPTHFEIVYLDADETRVRYGFDYTLRQIEREWLFISKKNKKELPYFVRDEEGIGVDEMLFAEGIGLEERTNDNRLFLSLVAQLGGTISKNVLDFFNSGYNVISGLNSQGYEGLTERQFLNKEAESVDALQFFKDLQLGFIDIETDEHEIEKGRKAIDVFTVHNIYNKDGEITGKQRFRFDYCESQGTQKLFELAGPLFEALRHGRLLVMDELDAKMHPLISQHIIKLFSSEKTNQHHAQLLFTTHDTNLLSSHLLRRDQIWFTEKDKAESTDLYSLMHIVLPDGTKPRGDGNLERNYIKGRYGAVPYLSTIE
ncbi:ATP-binding protein [Bacteroides ovatus]|uniref:AAA family ATPase n=1 Tax=Bacteroides ovatus TaxID=28116 RepID=UPI001896A8A8|nr:ATP-binding protein [Bacteroides ovatus]MDC2670505.1 ATP-binding protein [Bacteroides ovatus]MDC2690134.1 ATP-binding protein [Bacteroides ovatus]MDC2695253.1 ATP-binding protein [Bacteroides ovatus]MDC2711459.1 ATP-binding protein [Bacteroides ovatus]